MNGAGVSQTAESFAGSGSSQGLLSRAGLDEGAFFQLLVAQIRYQNPLEPMKDREFIAQLAQFSLLEEVQRMRQEIEKLGQQLIAQQERMASLQAAVLDAVEEAGESPEAASEPKGELP